VRKGRDEEGFKSPMEWVTPTRRIRRRQLARRSGWIKVVENAEVALNLND
jgi:hypothetical protein